MQVQNINNSPKFEANIKIKKTLKNQICDTTSFSTFSGGSGTTLSTVASYAILDSIKMNTYILISKLKNIFGNLKNSMNKFSLFKKN